MVKTTPEEGLQGDGLDARFFLLWPAEGPGRCDVAVRRRDDAGSIDGAAAQQQRVVYFNEGLPGVGVQVLDRGAEEPFLVGSGDGAVAGCRRAGRRCRAALRCAGAE
jgi:hypothetical protein